jgi:hypothetical protein
MRLAMIHAEAGSHTSAMTEAGKAASPWLTAYVYARARQPARALATLETMTKTDTTRAYDLAAVYTTLGRVDDAFHWLEEAYREHSYALVDLRFESLWDPCARIHASPTCFVVSAFPDLERSAVDLAAIACAVSQACFTRPAAPSDLHEADSLERPDPADPRRGPAL